MSQHSDAEKQAASLAIRGSSRDNLNAHGCLSNNELSLLIAFFELLGKWEARENRGR
jgi:hypothetical protein